VVTRTDHQVGGRRKGVGLARLDQRVVGGVGSSSVMIRRQPWGAAKAQRAAARWAPATMIKSAEPINPVL
jgi:hypothetical protein